MKNLSKIIILTLSLLAQPSFADTTEKTTIGASGYPLPRFMSLDDPKTNMRTGPGLEYPIDWIYNKEDYPLKVIAEHGNWRKIVDADGTTGWILRSLLSLRRKAVIMNGSQELVKSPDESNKVALIAEEDVIGTIEECQQDWCKLEIGGFNGWINHKNIWGVLEQETFD